MLYQSHLLRLTNLMLFQFQDVIQISLILASWRLRCVDQKCSQACGCSYGVLSIYIETVRSARQTASRDRGRRCWYIDPIYGRIGDSSVCFRSRITHNIVVSSSNRIPTQRAGCLTQSSYRRQDIDIVENTRRTSSTGINSTNTETVTVVSNQRIDQYRCCRNGYVVPLCSASHLIRKRILSGSCNTIPLEQHRVCIRRGSRYSESERYRKATIKSKAIQLIFAIMNSDEILEPISHLKSRISEDKMNSEVHFCRGAKWRL